MTCVWQSLYAALDASDKRRVGRMTNLAKYLQEHNEKTVGLRVGGLPLSDRELDENYEAVKCFNVRTIGSGYLCSTSDPFLCMFAHHFKIKLTHAWHTRVNIVYEPVGARLMASVASSRRHMSFRSRRMT